MIKGGRTPCLEGNWDQLFPSMKAHGLSMTPACLVRRDLATVDRGMWEFPLPEVRVPAFGTRHVVMMDFTSGTCWTGPRRATTRGGRSSTPIVLDTYRSVYQTVFNGNRAPLVIANHFNDWAGEARSPARWSSFMGETCDKPETVCATYTQVIQWMQLQEPGDRWTRCARCRRPTLGRSILRKRCAGGRKVSSRGAVERAYCGVPPRPCPT